MVRERSEDYKGRLERARYPIHLNAKPGGHRLSILEPCAAKRG